MIPILFPYDAIEFTTHGIGDLMETMRCESALNSDGEYELELEYPADGRYTSQLLIDNIIVAKVNDHQQNQAFRIYSIEKTINRTILVRAQHLSYDLKYWLHDPFWASTCKGAVSELRYAIGSDNVFRFNISTDVPNSTPAQNIDQKLKIEEPKSVRAILLDGDNSIKGTFGCDLIFDNWDIFLAKVGGADRGVLIEYGIDMVDMQQEENISEMITGVYPYWKGSQSQGENDEQQDVPYTNIYVDDPDDDSDDSNVVIPGDVIYAQGTFKRHHIIPLNISEYWVEDNRFPTRDEINKIARNWITANHIGEPAINLTISYAALPKNKNIRIHDAVTVNFVKMGIQTTAKVEEYKYDVLKERCIEITVGKAKPTILFDLEDASRLKRGLIPPKRIQNKSIQSQHIEPHTLESFQLSDGVVQSLGYADQFNAATLEDPVYETLPEHFSAKEMSILPQEGLDPLTLLNGVEATNLFLTVGKNVRIGETIYAQNFIVTIDRGIMESPMFCFPENENGEVIIAERTGYNVNHHTHTLTADDDGRVHIGKPDFLGKDNFFNIADTKFYKDHVSALTITRITHDSAVNVTYNSTTKNLSGYFTLKPMHDDTLIKSFEDQQFLIPATLAYEAGKADGQSAISRVSHSSASNVSYNSTTKNLSGDFTLYVYDSDTLIKTFSDQQFLIPATLAYEAGQTAITGVTHTTASNVSFNSTTKNLSGDFTLYVKNGNTTLKTFEDQQFLIPATLAYNAGKADGQSAISRVSHSSASNVSYNSTTKNLSGDFTLYVYDGDTLIKTFSDQQFLIPGTLAYNAGQAAGGTSVTSVTHTTASNVSYNSTTKNLSGDFTLYVKSGDTVIATFEDQQFLIPGTLAYEAGQAAGQTAITGVTHTTASNVSFNSTTKNLSGDFTLYVKNGNTILKTFEDQQFLIPATLAYEAGYDAGQAAGQTAITGVTHTTASNVSFNSTTKNLSGDFTLYVKNGDTTLKTFEDQQFLIPATSAYDAGADDQYDLSHSIRPEIGYQSTGNSFQRYSTWYTEYEIWPLWDGVEGNHFFVYIADQ